MEKTSKNVTTTSTSCMDSGKLDSRSMPESIKSSIEMLQEKKNSIARRNRCTRCGHIFFDKPFRVTTPNSVYECRFCFIKRLKNEIKEYCDHLKEEFSIKRELKRVLESLETNFSGKNYQ